MLNFLSPGLLKERQEEVVHFWRLLRGNTVMKLLQRDRQATSLVQSQNSLSLSYKSPARYKSIFCKQNFSLIINIKCFIQEWMFPIWYSLNYFNKADTSNWEGGPQTALTGFIFSCCWITSGINTGRGLGAVKWNSFGFVIFEVAVTVYLSGFSSSWLISCCTFGCHLKIYINRKYFFSFRQHCTGGFQLVLKDMGKCMGNSFTHDEESNK